MPILLNIIELKTQKAVIEKTKELLKKHPGRKTYFIQEFDDDTFTISITN
jgi:hypothetical protein